MGYEEELYKRYSPVEQAKLQKARQDAVDEIIRRNALFYRSQRPVGTQEDLDRITNEIRQRDAIVNAAKQGLPMPTVPNDVDSFMNVVRGNTFLPGNSPAKGTMPSISTPTKSVEAAPNTYTSDKDLLLKQILASNSLGSAIPKNKGNTTQPSAKEKSTTGKSTKENYPKFEEDKSLSHMLKTYLKLSEDESALRQKEFEHKAAMEQLAAKKELEGNFEQNQQAAANTAGANAFMALVPAIMGWGANPQSGPTPQLPSTANELPNQEATMNLLLAQGSQKQDNAQANLLAQVAAKDAAMNNSALNTHYKYLTDMAKQQFNRDEATRKHAEKMAELQNKLDIAGFGKASKDAKTLASNSLKFFKDRDSMEQGLLKSTTLHYGQTKHTIPRKDTLGQVIPGQYDESFTQTGLPAKEILADRANPIYSNDQISNATKVYRKEYGKAYGNRIPANYKTYIDNMFKATYNSEDYNKIKLDTTKSAEEKQAAITTFINNNIARKIPELQKLRESSEEINALIDGYIDAMSIQDGRK